MFAVPPNTVALSGTPASAHPALIARELAANPDRWRHLLHFHTDERFTTRLERTDRQEIWLMTWLPGQCTELHNHGGATGAFTVVSGALTEYVARASGAERPRHTVHRAVAGQSRVFGPGYVHRVRNEGPEPAVSIHVYRPARLPMIQYRVEAVDELRRVV
ncbi:MAG TPA: cysteine dioxygenase family protein [Actinophytocola sp.]|uniref:cysteine dioxygenase n=1 Tax=Actinophytocola sp. TaxID=1872138 RepID=UPI002DDCD836|nr:cysteine dioxygenase family protein [Actinophytocola sp.]HEV2781043.1 cysteine dioxygenase family protein [Actinophytocola sp.]